MEEIFPEEGKTLTPVSDRSRQIIKEQGNVEALELLELSKRFNVIIATETEILYQQAEPEHREVLRIRLHENLCYNRAGDILCKKKQLL